MLGARQRQASGSKSSSVSNTAGCTEEAGRTRVLLGRASDGRVDDLLSLFLVVGLNMLMWHHINEERL